MKNPGFTFTQATLDECVQAAERFAAEGADWHNHVLKPTCVFNPRPGAYALLIENNSSGAMLAHFADRNPVQAEQHIVKLRHGAGILGAVDSEGNTASAETPEPAILTRIRALARQGADWHHHMMFPGCVLNPRQGEWLITLEVAGETAVLQYTSDEEPFEVLREIERLFFARETGA